MSLPAPAFQVVALGEKDINPIADLHAAAFPVGQAWSTADLHDLLASENVTVWALKRADHLIAFALIQTVTDQAEILTLACDPEQRRKGYSRHLIEACELQMAGQGICKWLLDVAADNPGAIAFYEKLGFTVDGRRPRYYGRLEGKRVDAILMSKPLAGQVAP